MDSRLNLEQIQGNITPGFNKPYQSFTLLRFQDQGAARSWFEQVPVTSAADVVAFRQQLANAASSGQAAPTSSWTNVALSAAGLRLILGPARSEEFQRFPYWFTTKGDFQIPGIAVDVHAVVTCGSDASDLLEEHERSVFSDLPGGASSRVGRYAGARLAGGREQFGFEDGVSQPRLDAPNAPSDKTTLEAVAPGEFIFGYADTMGEKSNGGPPWTADGSYMVFWKLRQDVAAFRRARAHISAHLGLSLSAADGAIVGRSEDGQTKAAEPYLSNSHIGRARGLAFGAASAQTRRLIRRGIPYGDALPPGITEDDGNDRGLLFVTYQADIERQFETVWLNWLNPSANVRHATLGRDALVGQATWLVSLPAYTVPNPGAAGVHTVRFPSTSGKGGTEALDLAQFVAPMDGGYFFAPSLSVLSSGFAG
jgi:Dyp-type peroxidase family